MSLKYTRCNGCLKMAACESIPTRAGCVWYQCALCLQAVPEPRHALPVNRHLPTWEGTVRGKRRAPAQLALALGLLLALLTPAAAQERPHPRGAPVALRNGPYVDRPALQAAGLSPEDQALVPGLVQDGGALPGPTHPAPPSSPSLIVFAMMLALVTAGVMIYFASRQR